MTHLVPVLLSHLSTGSTRHPRPVPTPTSRVRAVKLAGLANVLQFPAGDPKAAVSVGSNAFFGGGRAALRQVQCPLPPAVVQVRGRAPSSLGDPREGAREYCRSTTLLLLAVQTRRPASVRGSAVTESA